MWSTVLVLALSVICEPVRIGLVVLMLNRRRPLLHLLTFLCGGYTMAGGVAMVTLVVLGATRWPDISVWPRYRSGPG